MKVKDSYVEHGSARKHYPPPLRFEAKGVIYFETGEMRKLLPRYGETQQEADRKAQADLDEFLKNPVTKQPSD